MNTAKDIAKKAVALLIFAAIIAAVILYQAGFYDISFIKRPARMTEEPGTDGPPSTDVPATESETSPVTEPVPDPDEAAKFIEAIPEGNAGKIKTGVFSSSNIIKRLAFTPVSGDGFSLRRASRNEVFTYQLTYQYLGYDTRTVEYDLPVIGLYFGYVTVDNGTSFDIYLPDGTPVAENFDGSFPYMRVPDGTPVVERGGNYYLLEKSGISRTPVEKEQLSSVPVYYDFPEYVIEKDYGYTVYSDWYLSFEEITTKPPRTTEPPVTDPDTTSDSESTEPPTEPPTDPSQSGQTEPPVTDPETEPGTETETVPPQTDPVISEDTGSQIQTETVTVTEETMAEEETGDPDVTEPEVPTSGTETLPTDPDLVSDGETITVNGTKYVVTKRWAKGYKDKRGKIIVTAKYEEVYPFSENGICAVRDFNGEIIFVTNKNKVVVNKVTQKPFKPKDIYLWSLQRHLAPLNSDDYYAVGTYLFSEGYCMVRYALTRDDTESTVFRTYNMLVDAKGKYFEIPDGYKLVSYSDGVLLLEKNGLYGYLRNDGTWIKAAVYEEAHPYFQGLAVVCLDGRYGLIDLNGDQVLPVWFDYLSDVSRGLITAYSETRGWEIYCVN